MTLELASTELRLSDLLPLKSLIPKSYTTDFADLAEPVYATIMRSDIESSGLLNQVDIGDRSFFDLPQRQVYQNVC